MDIGVILGHKHKIADCVEGAEQLGGIRCSQVLWIREMCPVDELRGVRGRVHNDRRQKEMTRKYMFAKLCRVLVSQATSQWRVVEIIYHVVRQKVSKDQEMGGGRNEGGRC